MQNLFYPTTTKHTKINSINFNFPNNKTKHTIRPTVFTRRLQGH